MVIHPPSLANGLNQFKEEEQSHTGHITALIMHVSVCMYLWQHKGVQGGSSESKGFCASLVYQRFPRKLI